ncbi:hypothetical protein DL764_002668 [Monosporascus ibericus]|uniref:WDR59/RTC1-like RING zinc finger domain-containing protein n=1 Tax=Monosporascus ibericus TaxID=155417 RepID=A0A4Q4TLC0_9PEZI|nr:hypothetical protein DL764_002668 [Monosporascus ibericus]
MPSTLNQAFDVSKKGKVLKSAYDSDTFDVDGTIHVAGLVGSATISPSGRDIALASPEGLSIIDLDSPYSPPRKLSSHGSPWLVVDVQWSPFAARDYWVASTANHRCLVWNLNLREDSATGAIEHSLQGHSRAITDINFSAHHPDFLATCAVDGYVHSWDLRKPRQPVLTFCDWLAGATQVKYNRQDNHILASSHDRWLHIWDERKPSTPLKSISAHTSKIYGLDWNRTSSTGIATCSLDKSIKLWDYEASDKPERIIQTSFPVWRARYTPFGWGLLAMPQNDPGNLYLYDRRLREDGPRDGPVEPVKVFPGPASCKAKEFLWRSRGGITDDGIDNREFQLVSWGEDNELRLHRVDPDVLESIGHIKGGPALRKFNLTRKGATYKTFRTVDDSPMERRTATMSDPHPGSGGGQYRRNVYISGMQTMPSYYSCPGTASAWRGLSMRAKSKTGKPSDRSRDQLGWMKGIMMSKKRISRGIDSPQRKDSKDSSMLGPGFHDNHWGDPETVQEEILRVSQQLPNVHWEDVDMDKLTLKASLEGPWGADNSAIYITVHVDIPHNYPKSRPPRFLIEKTALMSEQTHKKLDRDVQQLANQFSKRRQNCLEVIFSYFLGETDLSNSDSFFKNVRDLDDYLDGLADESSSEDDDDIPAGGSASLSQELTASMELDATLAPGNRAAIPPDPCRCGARFSNDGRLVCFFPSKEAKNQLFSHSDAYKERPKDEPTFAGFGRLQPDPTPPRRRGVQDETSATEDQSDTDESSSSSTSSSDSETTYMHKINMWYLPGRRLRKAFSGTLSLHSSGGGTGIGTGTGTGTSRRRPAKPKNILSIHNFSRELPSQPKFAQEYCIFGDGAAVCEHNAKVAEKYGRPDLVDVWRYAALLLRKDIPLELLDHGHHNASILVIAKDAVARSKEERLGTSNAGDDVLTGRVKWGEHPLAKELVRELFNYFESIADIQMLAMLSCIFIESITGDGATAYAESRLSQPETPLAMKAPAFSLGYFPTDASLWHSSSRPLYNSAFSTPKTAHTPIHIPGSYGSDRGAWEGDPGSNSYSCGETPPSRTPRDILSDGDPTQSLSTSPNNKLLHRASNALSSASGFAASFPRAFANVASTSPPSRKRQSPGENFLANLAPSNITWGGSTILGPTSEPSATARNSLSDDEARRDNPLSLVCYGISTEVEDQSIFDDDGWLTTPLLEPARDAIFASYRRAYAEMLQMWGQPLARLEILKFNVLKEDPDGTTLDPFGSWSARGDSYHDSYHSPDSVSQASQSYHGGAPNIVLGKKEQLQAVINSGRGIDVKGLCRVHETQLEPMQSTHPSAKVGGAVGTCERCKRTQTQLMCVYCREPIDALYCPCLTCGCATHESCLAEWYAADETECPAGDECRCVEHASEGVVETYAAIMGAVRQQSRVRKPSDEKSDVTGGGRPSFEKNYWGKVAGGANIPSANGQGEPMERSQSHMPLSAAKFSLGTRLRKSAGEWGSTTSLRKKSTPTSSTLGRGG